GRCGCAGERNRNVQWTIYICADRERSGVGETDLRADALALVELAAADAEGSLAVAEDVPSNAETRGNVVIVVLRQSAIDTRSAGTKRQPNRGCNLAAEVGARNQDDTVASVRRISRRIVGLKVKRGHTIVGVIRFPQERPAEAISERHTTGKLPRIADIEFD